MVERINKHSWKRFLSHEYVTSKILEKGIVWCMKESAKRIINIILCNDKEKRIYNIISSPPRQIPPGLLYTKDWLETFSYIKRAIFFYKAPKRILGIMDFNRQFFALGDTVTFHENLFILKEKHNAEGIDICIVEDLTIKEKSDPKKELVMQTFKLNPHIENIFDFDNRNDYNQFRLIHLHKYYFFPNRRDQFHCDHRPLLKYQKNNSSLPKMSVNKSSLDWAKGIIELYVRSRKLIVIQIRNTLRTKNPNVFPDVIKGKSGAALRNTNLPEWEKFFLNVDKNKYQIICVCSKDEIIPSWRENNLVIFSKDLGADLMKDFALVQCSYLSLFPPSGVFDFALFAGTPCCVFNYPLGYGKRKGNIYHLNNGLEDYEQYNYQSPYQRLIWGQKDTFDIINFHFNELVVKLKNGGYDDEYRKKIQISEGVMS